MFENDNPQDRRKLVNRLRQISMPASEWESGGGIIHVIVPLLQEGGSGFEINAESEDLILELQTALENNPYNPYLYIATNSLRTSCEIGLMGEDAYGNFVTTKDWEYAPEIKKAELLFEDFWKERDAWLKKWILGGLSR